MLILFGLSGSGKNYVGEILAKRFGYYFWDADTVLPKDMIACIKNKEPFTQAMRDNFTNIIIHHINGLQKHNPNLVIAQAFYKEQNRLQLKAALPNAELIYIQAPAELINKRLSKKHELDYVDYAEKISQNFEKPLQKHSIIINDTDEEGVIKQLNTLLNTEKNS